jgi:hypothetical protein
MKRWVLLVSLASLFSSFVSAQTPTPTPATTTTGIGVSKSCPPASAPGAGFTCTFQVQNQDPANNVTQLVVTNTVPSPGGTTSTVQCFQGITAVTVLAPLGTPGGLDTCQGSVDETAPPCGATDSFFTDEIDASGVDDAAGGTPVFGSATGAVLITACTPTPTNTPTNTPTSTPTNTPTNTPSTTSTPTNTPTNTPTLTATPTNTPTNTPTLTATPTNTPTNTPTRTNTPTNTFTSTPVPQQTAVVPTLSFPMLGLLAAALIGAALWVLKRR